MADISKLLLDIGILCPTAPERIWLQVDPQPETEGYAVYPENPAQDDVTWCADKINTTDTLYIRADKVFELLRAYGVMASGDMRAEFNAWVESQGCDTDGAWSAWQGCWNLLHTPGATVVPPTDDNPPLPVAWMDQYGHILKTRMLGYDWPLFAGDAVSSYGVPAVPAVGILPALARAVEASDEGHDPLCMAILRGKACSCGFDQRAAGVGGTDAG